MMLKVFIAIFMLTLAAPVYSQMGYSRDPWGSNTWTGPGRPPHWGPPQHKHRPPPGHRHPKQERFIVPQQKPPGYVRPKPYDETRLPEDEPDATRSTPRLYHHDYHQGNRQNPIRCSGATRTTVNGAGQTVIEYVTGARDCSR